MKLIITSHNLGLWAADYIRRRKAATAKRPFVLGLPTGSTVEDMYAALTALVKNGQFTFADVVTFNMDEYVGLPPQHAQSYHYYMQHHLFGHVDAQPENIHILNGMAADLDAECAAYEQAITAAGGIDLFLGGVGRNGHLAFNEPGSAFTSRTRVMELTESTRRANARFFNESPQQVPARALTVGIGTVLDARELLFLASGPAKAEAVARLMQGDITPQWPITALKTHPHATLLVDDAAAAQLDADTLARLQALRQSQPQQDLVLTL